MNLDGRTRGVERGWYVLDASEPCCNENLIRYLCELSLIGNNNCVILVVYVIFIICTINP